MSLNKFLIGASAAAVALALYATPAFAATPIVVGPITVTNADDIGTCNNTWAQDNYDKTFTITDNNDGTFTVHVVYTNGTFVTNAGNSPGACESGTDNGNTVPVGVNGTIVYEQWNTTLTGTLSGGVCTTLTCTSSSEVFNTIFNPGWTKSDWTWIAEYTTPANGTWFDTSANWPKNDTGDITGSIACFPTGFLRDGKNLTAALIDPSSPVSGNVNATGCNIGVYYGPNSSGKVDGADISGANYYGVVAQQAAVDVRDSTIHNIGENPFNGAQHGIGIYYASVIGKTNGDCIADGSASTSGSIDGNTISAYQKGGIVVACPGANVTVTNNQVLGEEQIPYIAQNGIQFGYGASGNVRGNTIVGNYYTGASWTSTGLLLFDVNANAVKRSNNMFRNNQTNLNVTTSQACPHLYGGFYNSYGLCTF